MELEFRDDRRRGRLFIVIGIVLAIAAGGGAFLLVEQAQRQSETSGVPQMRAVVAQVAIPARQTIKETDVAVREVVLDPASTAGIVTDPRDAVGRVPAVPILQGQIVTTNVLASTTEGGQFALLSPDETVSPDSPAWRAVSITVADDLAVGGTVQAGRSVDIFVTAIVNVPADLADAGRYYVDRSTKIVYQGMLVLARAGDIYVLRAPLAVAEELSHLQATGSGTFSMALRPDSDTRVVDTLTLGETTNRLIQKYGLPIPEAYPSGRTPVVAPSPLVVPTPAPSAAPAP